MVEKQEDFYNCLDGDEKLVANDKIKCEVFGCCNTADRSFQFAPGTIVWLCIECYTRESEDIMQSRNEETTAYN